MRIGLLGNRDSWYVEALQNSAGQRGHHCACFDYRLLAGSEGQSLLAGESANVSLWRRNARGRIPPLPIVEDLTDLDAVVIRTMPPGSLEQVVFRMDLLARLEAGGVRVLNPPKAIECAVDKYLATTRLSANGLPVPPTIVCQDSESAMEALALLGGDVVVKPLFGAEGRGIVRVSDPDLAIRTFRTLERIGAVLYLQRFVAHEGYDIRVLILGGRLVGAMKRRSSEDFRTNVARSAVGESHELLDSEAELALRSAAATGAVFAGVDLLYDRNGVCYVLEVNAVPGWRAFQRVTGIDVAERVLSWLETSCCEAGIGL